MCICVCVFVRTVFRKTDTGQSLGRIASCNNPRSPVAYAGGCYLLFLNAFDMSYCLASLVNPKGPSTQYSYMNPNTNTIIPITQIPGI